MVSENINCIILVACEPSGQLFLPRAMILLQKSISIISSKRRGNGGMRLIAAGLANN